MVIVNCESEPVSKTAEFNRMVSKISDSLVSKDAKEYSGEEILEIEGVKDNLVEAIGLLKENIKIQKGIVIEAKNIGVYVRSTNKEFPQNGTYASIVGLNGGSVDLSTDLATHCVLELPDLTGEIPSESLDIENLSDNESRLLYQALNGGRDIVFNVLEREKVSLNT